MDWEANEPVDEVDSLPVIIEPSPLTPAGQKPMRNISQEQYAFLSYRLRAESDEDAIDIYNRVIIAAKLGKSNQLPLGRIKHWRKTNPDFDAEYRERLPQAIKANAERQATVALPTAVTILTQALEAQLSNGLPDWRNRTKAVELVLRIHGMLKDRMELKPDLSNLADEEVLKLEILLARLNNSA